MDEKRIEKIKAAIIAVTYYIIEEKKQKKGNSWKKFGREQIIKERHLVFTKNFRPWNNPFILGRQIA